MLTLSGLLSLLLHLHLSTHTEGTADSHTCRAVVSSIRAERVLQGSPHGHVQRDVLSDYLATGDERSHHGRPSLHPIHRVARRGICRAAG